MPTIGGVFVPDELMPRIDVPQRPRPGFGEILSAAASGAAGQLRYGLPYQVRQLTGGLSEEDEGFYQRGLAETARVAASAAPATVQDLTAGRAGIGTFIGENLVASLPYMAGALVGGIGGGLVGGPAGAVAGAVAAGTPQFAASNVARAVEEEGGLSEAAAARALAVAPFQSAADVAIARFLPGAGKVLGDLASTQTGGFLRRTAMSVAKAGGTEAITEAAQQVGERYAAGLPVSDADAAAEYTNAAVTALAVGGALGIGGGFRRTDAVAKPAAAVTNDDMLQHINGILDGSLRAAPEVQLGLPLQGGATTEQQMGLPLAAPAETAEVPPSQLPQLGLDPAFSTVAPDTQLELGQRFTDNITPVDIAAIGGTQVSPEAEAALAGVARPAPQVPLGSQPSARAMFGVPVGETNRVEPNLRAFAGEPLADLITASNAGTASPEIRAEAGREIATRWAEAAGTAPLTADDYQTRLDELKTGLRGGWVQGLTAADPTELVDKVYARIFDDSDVSANVQKLAQRVGLIDADLQPTALAREVEARRAAAQGEADATTSSAQSEPGGAVGARTVQGTEPSTAPMVPQMTATSDPAFAAEWEQLKKAAGITRLRGGSGALASTPANLEAARAQVFRALADDKSNAEVSQVEKLARQMGLITDDDAMDVTPLGRQAWLSTPEGFEETISAAQQQGYTGAQASIFDRGVRAQTGGAPVNEFASFEDMAAYEAGRVWAQNFVETDATRTAAQTEAIRARQGPRATATAVPDASRRELTPQQVQQRALNRLLDTADMRGASPDDVAALFRMVRDGAAAQDVGQALQQVQQGGSLFEQPATTPTTLTPTGGRGQPRFREMNTPDRGPSRAANRAETQNAVATKRAALRAEIDAAFASDDITARERIGLLSRLVRNDFAGVVDRLPGGPLRNDMNVSRRDVLAGIAATAATGLSTRVNAAPQLSATESVRQLSALARSGNIPAILRHLADHGAGPGYKAIARKLDSAGGWDRVTLRTADAIEGLYGTTALGDDGTTAIELYGDKGLEEETILHELIHAFVQQRWAGVSYYGERNKAVLGDRLDRHDKVITGFADLWTRIGDALKKTNPELVDGESWAANFYNNPDEALSWTMTNKDAQAYLRSVDENGEPISAEKSLWTQFVDWIRDLLGLPPSAPVRSALDQILQAGHAVLDAGKDVATNDFSTRFAQQVARQNGRMDLRQNMDTRTAQGANEATKAVARAATTLVDQINPHDMAAKARRTALGWLSHNQLDRMYADQIPAIVEHSDAHRERVALRSRFEQMGENAYQSFEALERANKNAAEWVGQLMGSTTEFQIDPDKTWDAHTWLHDDPNAASLKRLHGEMVQLANKLKRGDGAGWKSFNDFRALNEAQNYARMAVGLHSLVATDPELSIGVDAAWVNPADQFMRADGLTTPAQIRDYWKTALDRKVAAAVAFVNEKKGESDQGSAGDQRAMRQHLSPIEMQIGAIAEAQAAMARAPYFHLGRFGDNFGSAVIAKNEDGTVDPAAQRKVAAALEEAGFTNAQISADNTKPRIMLRFDTVDQALRFRDLALKLQKQGLLGDDEIKVGPRDRSDNFGTADGLPAFVASYIQNLEASPMFAPDENMSAEDRGMLEKLKRDTVQLARDTWIESQPDTAISKMLTKRNTIAGYNKDMIRNFAHRWRVGSINIANVASAPKFNRAFTNMRAQYNDALVANRRDAQGQEIAPSDPFAVQDVISELKMRDARNPVDETADTFDKLRAAAHSYFLGFSPAYGMINMTQLGVTALPEMAKKHGYTKTFHAMRRAAKDAFSILRAVGSEATRLGWKHWGDVAVTDAVLRQAGLSDQSRNFLTHMLATGTIDIGSMARSLGQVAENKGVGGGLDTYLKLSSAIGLYTETFSRLVTALAARDLHGGYGEDAQRYAAKTVSESMFDYQNWNTARQLGKKGFLGPITPLLTQFMSYSVQVTEKLYSEALDAFGKARPGESAAATAARKAEARKFLAGHMAAVTTLAGTMGLPFATVFATVLERMIDAVDDDDEPFDATAAYRNFLSSVFGKEVGEVVARGAPRALGFDISARAGEQNLMPFSEFFADRRSWKDAVGDTAGRSLGAVPNMLTNILDGGSQIADGDLLSGLKTLLPIAFKGPIEAYRLTTDGYIDTRGNKLPISPGASAAMWQLLGFSPSGKAEYGEARGDQAARRGEITRRAGRLRQQIVRALIAGDNETARELISEAIEFDVDNPAFAVIPSLTATLQRQQRARAMTQATGAPVGVSMRDIAGQGLTQYANY